MATQTESGIISLFASLLVVGGKGVLDHTDLRSVAVGDDDLVTVFDQIGDCFCGDMDGVHLLMQILPRALPPRAMTILLPIFKFPIFQ